MADAVIHRPGSGEHHRLGEVSELFIKAGSEQTNGTFYMAEMMIEPGFAGPPPHRHERLVDMFYVLEGVLTMRVGDETYELEAGTFVCAPPGVTHTFSNPGDTPVRALNFSTPGGWENYMRELAQAASSGPLTPDVIGQIASRYDFQVV